MPPTALATPRGSGAALTVQRCAQSFPMAAKSFTARPVANWLVRTVGTGRLYGKSPPPNEGANTIKNTCDLKIGRLVLKVLTCLCPALNPSIIGKVEGSAALLPRRKPPEAASSKEMQNILRSEIVKIGFDQYYVMCPKSTSRSLSVPMPGESRWKTARCSASSRAHHTGGSENTKADRMGFGVADRAVNTSGSKGSG